MKAIRYHIPDTLASAEKSLQQEISFYEAKVSEENNFEKRDNQKLRLWNDYLLVASQKRDSLKKVFENNYPEYYALKYNTQVIKTGEIPYLIGRDKNYISYVISDSLLYILVVNRKHTQLFVRNTDSSFFRTISQFRKLLSDPELSGNALNEFNLFQMCGYRLYSYLIEPVKEYLISDKLIISPDNSLAFFPFETLVTDDKIRNDLLYRKLPYLMKDYQISYTYSATLLSESKKTKSSLSNTTLIFAPSYHSVIYVDSLLIRRQPGKGILSDLPFAREESVFVSHLTSGKLYQDDLATESAFKDEAGKFDIIHLAMHTVLNEKDPMNSGMIFSKVNDLTENRYLNTYEIYGISLNAKMVVLSSCYTGTGTLYAGEGVLSLARGFIFAGSRSVVMSLWEVDDRSGTDIVKLFYKNLKSGNTKSRSLRKARIKYMENSDKLRSHPYFWSTLVIYGDDSPLYYKMSFKILFILIPVLLICSAIIYFRKRRYS
jgi:CHAT domain-containing protein